MLCQMCGKREATFHFKEIINGEVRELHLCEECAKKMGLLGSTFPFVETPFPFIGTPFPFASLIGSLTEKEGILPPEVSQIKCPHCGLSYEQIREKGKIGCSECYQIFKDYLLPLLERIQGHTHHSGKSPTKLKMNETEREIHKLRKELEEMVKKEEYEKAAEIRDKIRKLEKKGKTNDS